MGKDTKIGFFTRLKIAIFKLEDYGTFLGENFSVALKYFFTLILLVSIIISMATTYQVSKMTNKLSNYIQEELPDFTYEDGKLNFLEKVNAYDNDFEMAFIVDTSDEIDEKTLSDYKNKVIEYGIILLADKAIFISEDLSMEEEYKTLTDEYGFNIKNKSDLISQFSKTTINTALGTYFIADIIGSFIVNVISVLIDLFIVAIFGWIASRICGIAFSTIPILILSIYSVTLSVVLNSIYACIRSIIGFEIPYFDMICLLISYIYIIAAIFMIKYDLIKQKEELQKIIDVQQEVKREKRLKDLSNEDDKKNDEEGKSEDTKEKEENKDSNSKEEEPPIENREPDGSEI